MLSPHEVKAFYDRFGARQDAQAVYEDRALRVLELFARFDRAEAVLEFGCGTGRWAERLLANCLPADASYRGIEVSDTMLDLAGHRLRPWGDRAAVSRGDGSTSLPGASASVDRVVATYVLDLLDAAAIRMFIEEAHRVLVPGGMLCIANLTPGNTVPSRVVSGLWRLVHAVRPHLVGGCRPIVTATHLSSDRWRIVHAETVRSFGIASEAVIASPRPGTH